MKKTARNIVLIVVAVLLVAALVVAGIFFLPSLLGGNQNPVASGKLQVNTIKIMPYAYMGESFDLRDVLLMEDGVEYSATACYVDIETMTEYTLEVNDLCFTPQVVAETVVVITAKRGSETASKVIYIPTSIRAEPLDDLYKSSGELGGADPGISKDVNIDPLYLQGDTSTTSLHVSFNSTDPHPYGNSFMNFSSEKAQVYFTDQVWENAIVTFWVYNPMPEAIEFQFRHVDDEGGVNFDWQTVDGPHKQRAEPGQWTQLFWSLRKLGTTRRLTGNKFNNDLLLLKFRYDAYSTTEAYAFDFYIDNIDVVDGSVYPEIDTKYVRSNETIEQGWENMKMDTGWQGVYTEYDYDNVMGEGSTCSLKATFPGDKGKTNSFICLSPEAQFDENPDMTGGTLGAYFKFENMDTKVSLDIVNKKWETSNRVDFALQNLGGGWYYGEIDLEDVQVGNYRNDEIIRIRFHFSGVSDSSVVFMDTVIYNYKHVEKVFEAASTDLINMSADSGAYYLNVAKSFVTTHLKGGDSVRSLKMVAPSGAVGRYTWNTSASYNSGEIDYKFDMTSGTLGAWFYFGNQLPNANIVITNAKWKGSIPVDFVFTKNTNDGWYYGELHASDITCPEGGGTSEAIRITLQIPAGYTVYIDNMSWKPGVENTLTAAEINPDVLYDGGDMLADTNNISHNKTHWENVENTDDFDKDGKVDPDVTTGLTCGVDTENVTGKYSVRSWYFKASAENAFKDATAQLQFAKSYDMTGKNLAFDIKIDTDSKVQQAIGIRLHNGNWGNLNDVNKIIKLNPGDWRHIVVNFDDVLKDDADLTDLKMISFFFDFFANTGKERAIYIDNVRLTTDAATEEEAPLPLGPEDQYDGGDMLAGTDKLIYNKLHWDNVENTDDFNGDGVVDENVTSGLTCGVNTKKANLYGKYSVRSWYFKAKASNNFGDAVAQLQLAQSYNMTGKNLAFDIRIDSDSKVQQTIGVRLQTAGWSNINEKNVTVKLNADETWKTVVMDFSDVILEGADLTNLGFISFYFDFAANTGKDRAIYIDNVRLTTDKATGNDEPFALGAEDQYDGGDMLAGTDKLIYNKLHWDNVENTDDFNGDGVVDENVTSGLTCGVNTKKANLHGKYSVRSWYFKAKASNNFGDAVAQLQLAQSYNMTGKNLAFDIRIDSDSKVQQTIGVRLQTAGWSNINEKNVTVKLNADETWKTVVMDFSDVILEGADLTNLGFISFYFDFAANTGKDRAIYIDNVRLTTDKATGNDEPFALGAEDQYDGGDMLAGTDKLIYNKLHWDNVENTDDFNGDGVVDENVTSGLTCGVNTKKANLNGKYSVRSWYFKAKASNSFNNATAQLQLAQSYNMTGKKLSFDIRIDSESKMQQSVGVRLHHGWSNINDQTVFIKLNADETWKTVVLDFSDVILDTADLTNLSMITFYFDFAANTGKNRAIYIDNVYLVDDSVKTSVDDIPEKLTPADEYDGGDLLANATAADQTGLFAGGIFSYDANSANVYKDNEVGKYSVKSWKFSALPTETTAEGKYPTALLNLGRSVNMNGKVLALDAYIENGNGSLSIYTIHDSSWGKLNPSENAANYRNETVAGQWVTLYYDLASMLAEGKDLSDVRFIKFQFSFKSEAGLEQNVYIDNVRLIDPSDVPPADDVSIDWTNMSQDKGAAAYHNMVTNAFSGEYVMGENSIKSLHLAAPAENEGRFTLHTEVALINGDLDKLPNMNGGILGAWFYFGDQTPSAYVTVTEQGWKVSRPLHFTFGENQNGWYYGTVDFSNISYAGAFYPGLAVRVTFNIPAGYEIYVDSMTFQAADIPDPSDPVEDPDDLLGPVKSLEYNNAQWTPANGLTVKPDTQNIYTTNTASVRSMSFKATAAADVTGAVAQFKLPEAVDMTGYNLAFDVFYDAATKLQQKIELRLHSSNGNINDVNEQIKINAGSWKTVVVNFDDVINDGADYSDLKLISFYFDFSSNTGYDRAVYIDNVRFTTDAETADDAQQPLDPSEQYDGGDLLAKATLEWNPALWDGDPASYDANSTEVCAEGTVGTHSVKSWKFYTEKDGYSEGVQLKLNNTFNLEGKNIEMDVKFVNATQTVGIELFNGWTALQPDNTPIATVTGDGSDGWQTLVVSYDQIANALSGKDHSGIALIRFKFNFTSDASGEHAVYIDNVRLSKSNYFETSSDLLGGATVDAADWTFENGLSVAPDTENLCGTISEQSWCFSATADAAQKATARFDLGSNVDMSNKYLLFDAKSLTAQSVSVKLLDEAGEAVTDQINVELAAADWTAYVANVSGNVLTDKTLSAVRYIEFTFDFASNTGTQRKVFIDNVGLMNVETVEQDWIHMQQITDDGFKTAQLSLSNAFMKADGSRVSMKVIAPADVEGMFTLNTKDGYSALKHRGTLSAWFYFGEQTPAASISVIDTNGNASDVDLGFTFGESVDGWYKGELDLSKVKYAEGVERAMISKITFCIPEAYTIYIDGLMYADITETAADDLINLANEKANGTGSYQYSTDIVKDDNSLRSLAATMPIGVYFTPEEALDLTNVTFSCWLYFGETGPSNAVVRFAFYSGSSNTGYVQMNIASEGVDGWYQATLDTSSVAANKQSVLSSVDKIMIQFMRQNTYMDYLTYTANEE